MHSDNPSTRTRGFLSSSGNRAALLRMASLMPAILIGIAFFIDLAGGRWGSYIRSPIPGLYLADLMLLIATVTSVFFLRELRNLDLWVKISYGIVWLYLVGILLPEFFFIPNEDRYDAIRDAAPFLYLALVPMIAVSLRSVSPRSAVFVVRITTIFAALGPLLVTFGIGATISNSPFGSINVEAFGYRTDLTGAALGIGIVAWTAWPRIGIGQNLYVQFGLILVGAFTISSRSGLLAVVAGILYVSWAQIIFVKKILVLFICSTAFMAGLILQETWTNSQSQISAPVGEELNEDPLFAELTGPEILSAPKLELDGTQGWSISNLSQLFQNLTRSETLGARLDTWSDVIAGQTSRGTWFFGGSAGSDYLYELCTGKEVVRVQVLEAGVDPKCAVDDFGPNPVVRDPHNWILNLSITHGLIGLALFVYVLGITIWRGRKTDGATLAAWIVVMFLISGSTFLISAGYALLPMCVALAWIVKSRFGDGSSKLKSVG